MENRSPENIIYTIFTCAFLFPVAVVMLPVIAMLGIAIYIAITIALEMSFIAFPSFFILIAFRLFMN